MPVRSIVFGLVLAMPGLPPTADRAGAAVLCTKKGGAVVLRPVTCKKKESALDLTTFGAQGPTGPAGAPGPPGAKGDPGSAADPAAFVRGNGAVHSAHSDLDAGMETTLFLFPGVGQLDVRCSGSTLLVNHLEYRNLSGGDQSWTREVVDQGNGLLILGGEVKSTESVFYESGAVVTDYSFHFRQTVHSADGLTGTTVTYDVTGLVYPHGLSRCTTHGVAIVTP